MSEWHPSVKAYLENKDYEKVVEIYENLVENNPDEINNYWYLGLSYLLINNLDEAQTTWFFVFSQQEGEGLEKCNQDLINILEEEALQQLNLSNYEHSLLIREQILEINPENINNLLHIVNLQILLKTFSIELLNTYNLSELVKNSQPNSLDFLLLSTLLKDIIKYAYNLSIDFAESVLIYSNSNKDIVNIIVNIGDSMAKEDQQVLYAIELLEMCNKYPHNNIIIFINLYTYYQLVKDFDKLVNIAEELNEKASNYLERFNAKNLLLNAYLTLAEWDKAMIVAKEQDRSYQEIELHKDELTNSASRDTFFSGILNLLYLQDDVVYNRQIINKVSSLFQEINKPFYPKITHTIAKEKKILTIGYIAHTLHKHSVGYLSRWLIYHHNRDLFKINLYSPQNHTDEITEKWFIPNVDKIFMAQRGMNRLINQIYEDEVDILVDLDSLTLNLTALVMAMKPAPIQVTWLGMDASGIPNIDYFIADPYVLPNNAGEYYSEKIWRLPNTYLGIDGFEMGIPTLRREDLEISNDAVIFLNVQNAAKLNPSLVELQMEIVKQVPNSFLIFKVRRDENRLKEYIYNLAENYHLDVSQLRFIGYDSTVEIHRSNLSIADVLLDTYPYNGATTTLEALWAELPVVTRVGEQFAARNTYGFMMNAGITEGIAWSDEEYIEWGIKLGKDENLRREVVWKLKQSKKNSPLWNGKQFTGEMEKAYQQMWEIYVSQKN
ncbi:MAG: O-linked N-acetylglucosamine transferase, SPINDLY family protein [Cyanobacteria bacterium]|nr:O-linked N-acetylglucosamine transferase, SPINDLY family protein [Cyanobacteria bacterium CG_2015-16_32_12]NCO78000.1 O-linked N-acetylglucosamine transferase, SPINDLY family protein [Cyanobacteria bacterium CG_2015-22_32_23]NCQ40687.1 O-linked N-acetylglucosamine transferase, SPINDLY family protein [Cyanobacteria bacterium CG_2015-04_32_10]NCS85520.1 O-linked N-acetylglucosamine transferase, SPINDLY family protein [Cyanobacteria bacterium CG_2015-02_32_10]